MREQISIEVNVEEYGSARLTVLRNDLYSMLLSSQSSLHIRKLSSTRECRSQSFSYST